MVQVDDFYITFCDDNNGYYCQVYTDENLEYEIDNFVIHAEELTSVNYNDKLNEAEKIATEYVRFRSGFNFEE